MFEDALMESGGRIKTKSKYWMIATFVFNGAILATLILIPLLYPEALPKNSLTATLVGTPAGVVLNPDGGFTAARPGVTTAGSLVFQYQAVNSQGTSSNVASVTVNFLAGSGLQVTVQDAQTSSMKPTDYTCPQSYRSFAERAQWQHR